ncbi:MAG TPA: TetR/AcrR family transcriptional regulator [Aromatoleum sp.]|uniref:acrylate utilization transcriptional regulator AcuR n=1 Tax=Aromatoleum sp. TaxID=2307007 RepID=UPI002B4948B4|nr:TetR/AcrR family transcriptional regulator [Aromatoleum sp.]HJV26555.1 TetR/AcrR family transcriptional regulator [Aromatoleum sp.]
MDQPAPLPRRPRGRPPRHGHSYADTRELLIRRGTELLTERGVSATALDEVLKSVGVPKGSFYHYFPNKDAFVLATLDSYAAYLSRKLDRHLGDAKLAPLARLQSFVDDACDGVERHAFARGCLVGNLGQEVGCLDTKIQQRLEEIFLDWEARVADCLQAAVAADELPATTDCAAMSHAFWIGWEGAILRARLMRSTEPMRAFFRFFMAALR